MKKQKVVAIGIVENNDGTILVAQRFDPQIPLAHLKWEFPGGTNEFGESLEETVIREIKEETGLTITVEQLLPLHASNIWDHEEFSLHALVFCFACSFVSGSFHLDDPKINALRWVSVQEAEKLDLLPKAKEFIDLFKEFKRNKL